MGDLFGPIAVAVGVFAGTNIDDFIALTVLFLAWRGGGRPRPWQIWIGQYAGIGVLVVASMVAALSLTIVPDQWVGLLGLAPIALGVRGLVKAIQARRDGVESLAMPAGLVSVVGMTIANGGDNMSAYTPIFRTIGMEASLVTVAVFAVLVAVWCAAASWLGSHKRVIDVVARSQHWLGPIVFVTIGTIIVVRSGVIGRLL